MLRSPAFTLIEIVLVIALLVLILAFAAPIGWSFVAQNDLDVSVSVAAQNLRRAQALTAAGYGGSGWGVELQSGQVILFQGSSFAGRNPDFDEVYNFPESLNVGGAGEVDFQPLTGLPALPALLTFSNSESQTANITVNDIGMVSY